MGDYEPRIKGEIIEIAFSDLLEQARQGQPGSLQIKDWMCTGPFVIETDGMFETEYMYQREKILEPDYLENCGGEKNVAPFLGWEIKNNFLGPEILQWHESVEKWNGIRFDGQSTDCDEALFLTDQRNAVYYAAVYIRCEQTEYAVVNYENSGCHLYLNGKKISEQPYGRLRGITDIGYAVAVRFAAGLNLLMFKIRPGYICDALDIAISHCSIYPVMAATENLALAYPSVTDVYTDEENPGRIYPCFAAAISDSGGGELRLQDKDFNIPAMARGQCHLLRLAAAATEESYQCNFVLKDNDGQQARGSFLTMAGKYKDSSCKRLVFSVFHFDTTYHQEQRVYAMGALHNLKQIVNRLRENPEFKATVSELDYLHPYYVIYPEDRAALRSFFREGRAEADCFYNQPNEMTSSGEALVRNLLYGQLYHRDVMGRKTYVYNPFDVFGHCSQLSQICAKGGCTGIAWGKMMFGLDPVFCHVSPDGTRLTHTHNVIGEELANKLHLPSCHAGENKFAANMPPYPQDKDTSWMENTLPRAGFAVQSDWQERLLDSQSNKDNKKQQGNNGFPLSSRDISLYHAGTALTRMDFKQANRLCENLLVSAEKLSVIAALNGAAYPEKALDKAWRQLLCGQHHDSITGTNNEISYIDLLIQYRETMELAVAINQKAAAYIASSIKTDENRQPVVVFNTHSWPRNEFATVKINTSLPHAAYNLVSSKGAISKGEVIRCRKNNEQEGYTIDLRFAAKVPAMGYQTFYLEMEDNSQEPGNSPQEKIENKECGLGMELVSIENEYYRITADPAAGGGIVSLFDKELDKELVDYGKNGPANRVMALKQLRDRRETQHEFYTTGHRLGTDNMPANVEVKKTGLNSRLIIDCPLGELASLHQEITLYPDNRRIDFQLRIDGYDQEDDLFCVTFPTAIKGAVPVFDDRFAPQVRNHSRGSLDFRTHQMMMFSHCAVYAANQWLDYGPSVTVKMQTAQQRGSINIGMSQIIRADKQVLKQISNKLLESLTRKAVPVTIYPDVRQAALKARIIHFNEDLVNDTRLVLSLEGIDNEYEQKILGSLPEQTISEFNSTLAEDGIVILYVRDCDNQWQKPVDVLLIKAKTKLLLDIMVDRVSSQLDNGRWLNMDVITSEQITEADDLGLALINNGNIACSVEKDGMLNLMLFHTAEFYGNIGKTNCQSKLVPEQKSHFFSYALYPHKESYREAEVYRRAFEFNDPLWGTADFQVQKDACLPEEKEYLRADGNGLITAIKAGGAPIASMKGEFGDFQDRGISIRLFEPHGVRGKTKLISGFPLQDAVRVDLLEENGQPADCANEMIDIDLGPHSIETLTVYPAGQAGEEAGELVAAKENISPAYVRSWEYDLGSMPAGFLAVAGTIGRHPETIDDKRFATGIYMVNSYIDRSISGLARLYLPEGWKSDQDEFSYELQAGEYRKYPVVITKPQTDAKGIIRLEYEHESQTFEDIYEIGQHKVEVELDKHGNEYTAAVTNSSGSKLSGSLYLASPIETWGEMQGLNPFALADLPEWHRQVVLAPYERKEYKFEIHGESSTEAYVVAKLCLNGKICFAGTTSETQKHTRGAEALQQIISSNQGSLAVLNRM